MENCPIRSEDRNCEKVLRKSAVAGVQVAKKSAQQGAVGESKAASDNTTSGLFDGKSPHRCNFNHL
jgi:hypothetical protein